MAWLYGQGAPKSTNVALAINKATGLQGDRGHQFVLVGNGEGEPYRGSTRAHGAYVAPEGTPGAAWQGWGTGLKPAQEPTVLARRPLVGTIAANVLRYGTAGIHVDACRIESDGVRRWPANLALDQPAAAQLDEQAGAPGPSRFFYVAKVSTSEREAGLEAFRKARAGELTGGRQEGSAGLNNPRAGAGHTAREHDIETWEIWVEEDRRAVLQVAMGRSRPKVTAVSMTASNDVSEWNTLLFGNNTTGPFLKECKCTIETTTSSTIGSRTLSYLAHLLTNEGTADACKSMELSINPVRNAVRSIPQLTIIVGEAVSLPGVGHVASGTRLRISVVAAKLARRCFHPTLKSIALMRSLIRLVTPPGRDRARSVHGLGLDGVCGSARRDGLHWVRARSEVRADRRSSDRALGSDGWGGSLPCL